MTAPLSQRFSRSHLAFGAALLLAAIYLIKRNYGLYPQVFADEWLYSQFSRLRPLSESTLPSFLFLGLYRATNACGPAFLECVRILNVAVLVAAAPLIYLVGKPVAGRTAALLIAAASVLAPFSAYTSYFMPEPLYFFGFWAITWLVLQRGREGLGFGLLAGAALGTLALVKLHALFLLPAMMSYLAWLGWRQGTARGLSAWTALRGGVAAAIAALAAAIAVKLLLGFVLAGQNGLSLLGTFYGSHVISSDSRPLGGLVLPTLRSLYGHVLGLLLIFGAPLLFIATGAARAEGRNALGQQGRALLLYGTLMFGITLAVAVTYTATIADISELEATRLHMRYYSFTFPLILIGAAACVTAAPPAQRRRIFLAALSIALLVAAAKLLPRQFHVMYVDSPELAAASRSSRVLWSTVMVSLLAAAAWAWRPSAGRALLLWVLLPATCIGAATTARLAQMPARGPQVYEQAGQLARARLTREQMATMTIIGPQYGNLMSANFQMDVAGPVLMPVDEGKELDLLRMPEEGWLLMIGKYNPPPYTLKRAEGNGFSLWQTLKPVAAYHIDFRQDYPAGVFKSTSGIGVIESWGRWSEGGRIELQFADPLPAHLTLRLTAHAFGANANADLTVAVGATRRTLRLSSDWTKQAVVFDNPGGETAITIDIPHPVSPRALGQGDDGRQLGIAVHQLDIGTLDTSFRPRVITASQHDHR